MNRLVLWTPLCFYDGCVATGIYRPHDPALLLWTFRLIRYGRSAAAARTPHPSVSAALALGSTMSAAVALRGRFELSGGMWKRSFMPKRPLRTASPSPDDHLRMTMIDPYCHVPLCYVLKCIA